MLAIYVIFFFGVGSEWVHRWDIMKWCYYEPMFVGLPRYVHKAR